MGVELGAIEQANACQRCAPSAEGTRRGSGREWRRYRRRHRQAAVAAAVGANCIPCPVGRGGRLIGDNTMTNSVIGLRNGIGRRARGAKIRDQAGERNRVSRDERDNALAQWPLRERHA
jgi:hypothetical protein